MTSLTRALCRLSTAAGRFNKKPKRGLAYLQQQGLLGPAADDVAELFHNDDRLNKTLVGDFMGENETCVGADVTLVLVAAANTRLFSCITSVRLVS